MLKNDFIIVAFVMITIITGWSCKDRLDCSSIKNGKFYYFTQIGRMKVSMQRTDSLQTEINPLNGAAVKSKVVWKDGCSFDMYPDYFAQAASKKLDTSTSGKPVRVDILYVGDKYYIGHVKMPVSDQEFKDTIYFDK